jgi:Flp pilus assembly protein TadG
MLIPSGCRDVHGCLAGTGPMKQVAQVHGMARRMARQSAGTVLIEFALTLPLLLLLILGIFDFGFAFQRYLVVTNAAREGARMAVLPGYDPTTDVPDRVRQYLTTSDVPGTPSITVTPTKITPSVGPAFSVYTVTVTLPYAFPFVGSLGGLFGTSFGSVTLKAASTMRTEIAAGGS